MRRHLFSVALVGFVAACGGEASGDHCTPDEQGACTCPDGTQSIRQCKSDGTWDVCQYVGK
jgi:hypothetical protein